jgi:hypothetical protein
MGVPPQYLIFTIIDWILPSKKIKPIQKNTAGLLACGMDNKCHFTGGLY